jgi:hypothetical protein
MGYGTKSIWHKAETVDGSIQSTSKGTLELLGCVGHAESSNEKPAGSNPTYEAIEHWLT